MPSAFTNEENDATSMQWEWKLLRFCFLCDTDLTSTQLVSKSHYPLLSKLVRSGIFNFRPTWLEVIFYSRQVVGKLLLKILSNLGRIIFLKFFLEMLLKMSFSSATIWGEVVDKTPFSPATTWKENFHTGCEFESFFWRYMRGFSKTFPKPVDNSLLNVLTSRGIFFWSRWKLLFEIPNI